MPRKYVKKDPAEVKRIRQEAARKRWAGHEPVRKRTYKKPEGTPEERAESQRLGRSKGGSESTFKQLELGYKRPWSERRANVSPKKAQEGMDHYARLVSGGDFDCHELWWLYMCERVDRKTREFLKRDKKCLHCKPEGGTSNSDRYVEDEGHRQELIELLYDRGN